MRKTESVSASVSEYLHVGRSRQATKLKSISQNHNRIKTNIKSLLATLSGVTNQISIASRDNPVGGGGDYPNPHPRFLSLPNSRGCPIIRNTASF